MIQYTASEETKTYYAEASEIEQAAIMFYVLEGWETGWPYPRRPAWLKEKYPDLKGDSDVR